MNLPTVLQWEMKMCSIELICIWTPIEHKGKPDWMERLITEYNVICSSTVTWITNQIASCQWGFKIRRQEWYQPGRQWQAGVCLVSQFYTSIPPSVTIPSSLSGHVHLCVVEYVLLKGIVDAFPLCVCMMEKLNIERKIIEGDASRYCLGRCAILFSSIEVVLNCQPKYQLTINHQSSAGGRVSPTRTCAVTHMNTHGCVEIMRSFCHLNIWSLQMIR